MHLRSKKDASILSTTREYRGMNRGGTCDYTKYNNEMSWKRNETGGVRGRQESSKRIIFSNLSCE